MTDLFRDADPEVGEPAEGGRRSHARIQRRRQERRRVQRRRTLISFVVMLVALALLVAAGWIFVRPLLTDRPTSTPTIEDYPGPGTGSAEVVISPGDSGAVIGGHLVEADVVASVDAFVAAYTANADAPSIQPGTYTLLQQIPASEAVSALLSSANRTGGLTIPEGWRASQIYERVAEVLGAPVEDVEAAAAEVELPAEAEGDIEGWLFPSTYDTGSEATPASVLQQMVDRTVTVLEQSDIAQDEWRDSIVLASIIEREVNQDEHRPDVSQVLQNRLQGCDGSTGLLGMDSTMAYALEKPANEITVSEWGSDNPYNGRRVPGLPPTAIASPGEASITAAANPSSGDFCYFVTVNLDTGETKFTASETEFQEFKNELNAWIAENRD